MRTMMQGFYWNCMRNLENSWYQLMSNRIPELKQAGIDTIWCPPPSQGMDKRGMGYDIKEHYNLNSAFGTQQELINLINKMKEYEIMPVVDTVMAHMIGGNREYNPYYEDIKYKHAYSYTHFPEPEFPKNYQHFCRQCGDCDKMESDFGEKICHYADDEYMKEELIKWGQWLRDEIGFVGFRLDYVKDIKNRFIKEWTSSLEADFVVGEYWSGDKNVVQNWIDDTQTKGFNFPLFYAIKDMCNHPQKFDMRQLKKYQLSHTVSFVDNHDTDRDEPIIYDKKLAYAYILLFTAETCVFWKDYYNYKLQDDINELLELRQELEQPLEIEYADQDLLVGTGAGIKVYINKSKTQQQYQDKIIAPRDYEINRKKHKLFFAQEYAN